MSTIVHKKIEWLQLSDLHVFPEADTDTMLRSFRQLAMEIHPQFIIVTGDYRHLKYNTDYNMTSKYLSDIVEIFDVEKKNVFLVPGNHDINTGNNLERDGAISNTLDNMNRKHMYSGYEEYLDTLKGAFKEYREFVSYFFKDAGLDEDDIRIKEPESVFCSIWDNRINLIHVNTALISDGGRDDDGNRLHPEIIDINAVSETLRGIDKHLPSIVLAHHGLESLHEEHRTRIEAMMREQLFSAYLHGDIHVHKEKPIRTETPGNYIPQIACGKSAPQDGDKDSDLGVVFYSWKKGDEVEVYVYQWTPMHGFSRNCQHPFAYGIENRPYTFHMLYEANISPLTATADEKKETEDRIKESLAMIIQGNCVLKRRDTIDYNAEDWIKIYSYPLFSNKRNSPIPSRPPFRTIVISPSGDGKSVMLQGLALIYAHKNLENSLSRDYQAINDAFKLGKKMFPISIRAKDFNTGERKNNILDYAVCSVQDEAERLCINRQTLETMCKQGEAVLLIDALDEVYENIINEYIELIKAHILLFPRTNIIITSRNIPGLRELQNCSFIPVKLCKFGEEQIESQIEKRCYENADLIKQRIASHVYLKEMATSPIMLATMLSRMSNTPNAGNVVGYLGLITDSIIKQRWKDFDLLNDKDKGIHALLSGLAWKMLCNEQDGIPKDELRRIIGDIFNEMEKIDCVFEWRPDRGDQATEERLNQLTTDLGRRSGILNLEDDSTRYVFQDRLVKWYLGASYVKRLFYESENRRDLSSAEILIQLDRQINLTLLKGELVQTLVMSFSLLQVPQQRALLQYLLLRATCSTDDEEIKAINNGLLELIENTFGTNGVLNPRIYSPGWELPSVIRWLRHHGDAKAISILEMKYPEYF